MFIVLFFLVGFSITNSIVFLHVFSWFRNLISGMNDNEFQVKAGSKLLKGFREEYLGRVVRCHACMGFWVGVFLSVSFGGVISKYVIMCEFLSYVFDGFSLSGFNFLIWVLLRRLDVEDL